MLYIALVFLFILRISYEFYLLRILMIHSVYTKLNVTNLVGTLDPVYMQYGALYVETVYI